MQMADLDKLIQYYFQRKISGCALQDIRKSLEGPVPDDEERELILHEVLRREAKHKKHLAWQRYGRYLNMAGGTLAAGSVGFIYFVCVQKPDNGIYIGSSLLLLACITLIFGNILSKTKGSY